ncbi:conserved hypothetical protein (putative transposase or invertase) [Amphibacillus marinus]|uniref:PD-(D/E)XK nuclease family transposase n=1 Tax=Amphibacillus marinus TaxID=872970 RepID=A0A1H8L5V0_9BACI|nr:PD-(D/E)XK nuclease family transposase [Amphibacillus marinus]SEO00507.1 conserved hypothetical protein (putative transposase or invertase) [Amphibacillus marinus]
MSRRSALKYPLHVIFHYIFNQDGGNDAILIDFLNKLLVQSVKQEIIECVYQKTDYTSNAFQLEIKARTAAREHLDIRIHICDRAYQATHNMREWEPQYVDHVIRESNPCLLKSCFIINMLNFNLLTESPQYHNVYQVENKRNPYLLYDKMEIHYFELAKLPKGFPQTPSEEWLYLLKQLVNSEKIGTWIKGRAIYQHAVTRFNDALNAELLTTQNNSEKYWYVERLEEQQMLLYQGKMHGQVSERERIVIQMIKAGYPYGQIVHLTGISIEELDQLAMNQYQKNNQTIS